MERLPGHPTVYVDLEHRQSSAPRSASTYRFRVERYEVACIPIWYHFGMSKQIAVRLSDELVQFVDQVVESGRERSRAAVVSRALERERRRAAAERDAEILAVTGPDAELAGLAGYAAEVDIEH